MYIIHILYWLLCCQKCQRETAQLSVRRIQGHGLSISLGKVLQYLLISSSAAELKSGLLV